MSMDGFTDLEDGRAGGIAPEAKPVDGSHASTADDGSIVDDGFTDWLRDLLAGFVERQRSGYATAAELSRFLKGRLGLMATVETVSGSLNPDVLVDDEVGVVLVDDTTINDLAQKLKMTSEQASHVVVLANGLSSAYMSEWLYLKRRFTASRLDVESVSFEGTLD